MGYTIKQKIEICLKAEANPQMTQGDLATWAMNQYKSERKPSQTTISRILSSKNDLIASKSSDFQLVRRRKQQNPLLRKILTEWITQALWENIPITTPIIQSTANAIWTRLPPKDKDGNGVFNQKWCTHFTKKLNANLKGDPADIMKNPGGYYLNKIWQLDDKLELKSYLQQLIEKENYSYQDIFTIDEFQLFHNLPLDQIFDVSSIDKGLKQSLSSTENSLTIMLGTNIDGSEKLTPLIVGKSNTIDVRQSSHPSLKSSNLSGTPLVNKITEIYNLYYKSNSNKWLTSSMFQNYLLTLEHKLASLSPQRKILILLDDSSSHRIINVKFSNIRLCYLRGNNDLKNSSHSSRTGVRLDYLPMSFGIIEEFKILYRIQQYLEMINIQNNSKDQGRTATLTELDYNIPLIKVIEWIKRSWDSISSERIILSWKRTHLFPLDSWPANSTSSVYAVPPLQPLLASAATYNVNKSYDKLSEIMGYLNVVIPWKTDDLLTLVNERGKVTLNYVSIEEIIESCCSEGMRESSKPLDWLAKEDMEDYQKNAMNINSLLTEEMNNLPPLTPVIENAGMVGNPNGLPMPNILTGNHMGQLNSQSGIQATNPSDSPSSHALNGSTQLGNQSENLNNEIPGSITNTNTVLPGINNENRSRVNDQQFRSLLPSSFKQNNGYSAISPQNNTDLPTTEFPNKRKQTFSVEVSGQDQELIRNLTQIIESKSLNLSTTTLCELQTKLQEIQQKYN